MCFLGPSGRKRRKLLTQYRSDVSDSRSSPVAGLPVWVPCRPLKRACDFLADRKRNDNKTKHPKLKEVHQPPQTVVQFIFWREYIIFQNIIYIHIFQMVQSNYRSRLEDSWSFFVIPKICIEKTLFSLNPLSMVLPKSPGLLTLGDFVTHSKSTVIIW